MIVSLTTPLGLLALNGVPILVGFYFIQPRPLQYRLSTAFLLRTIVALPSPERRLDRFRAPPPFWCQLIALLLATALLAGLTVSSPRTSLAVVVVLDGSASMSAWRSTIPQALRTLGDRVHAYAESTQWTLIASDAPSDPLASGMGLDAALNAIESWQPSALGHDLNTAVQKVMQQYSKSSLTAVITDHEQVLPSDVVVIGVGKAEANVGFVGGVVKRRHDQTLIEVLLRNYSDSQEARKVQITDSEQNIIKSESLTMAPRELRKVATTTPLTAGHFTLSLAPDRFAIDDTFPLVIPQKRQVRWKIATTSPLFEHLYRLLHKLPDTEEGLDRPDLILRTFGATPASVPAGAGQSYLDLFTAPDHEASQTPPQPIEPRPNEPIVGGTHPLVQGLTWGNLIVHETTNFALLEGDVVLVWRGSQPLVVLRSLTPTAAHLLVLFDIRYANARQVPVFYLLLHRFLDFVRQGMVAEESRNVDTFMPIDVPTAPGPADTVISLVPEHGGATVFQTQPGQRVIPLRAPPLPGFFTINSGSRTVLRGAASFSDPGEADLTEARTFDNLHQLPGLLTKSIDKRGETWPLYDIHLTLLVVALLLSWVPWSEVRHAASP